MILILDTRSNILNVFSSQETNYWVPNFMLKGRLYIHKDTGMLLCNLEDQSLVSASCGMKSSVHPLCSLGSLLKYLILIIS